MIAGQICDILSEGQRNIRGRTYVYMHKKKTGAIN